MDSQLQKQHWIIRFLRIDMNKGPYHRRKDWVYKSRRYAENDWELYISNTGGSSMDAWEYSCYGPVPSSHIKLIKDWFLTRYADLDLDEYLDLMLI